MKSKRLLLNIPGVFFGLSFLFLVTSASFSGSERKQERLVYNNPAEGVQGAGNYEMLLKRNQITGRIDAADVLRARDAVARMVSHPGRALGVTWDEMGPDNFGGRTRALLLDTRDASHKTLFSGNVGGGIWKSTTGGLTWKQLDGMDGDLSVTSMTQAPNGDIYVGTGELFSTAGTYNVNMFPGKIGYGILKSTDGSNFTVLPSTVPTLVNGSEADWAYVSEIAVDPANGRIYAATNTGLKYSDDGGGSWSLAKDAAGEPLDTVSTDVAVGANGMVVASVRNWCYISSNGDPNNFVSQSLRYHVVTDTTDTIINPQKLPMDSLCHLVLAIAPSDNNIVYAMTARVDNPMTQNTNDFGQLEGIYKSEDKGDTWRLIGPGGSTAFNVLGSFYVQDATNIYFFLGTYSSTLTVHPTDANRILAGGYDMWEGVETSPEGYYDWTQKSTSMLSTYQTYVHFCHHRYLFDPSNTTKCYIATDGGIFVTDDDFTTFRSLNKTYNTCRFYSISYSNKGSVMGGTQGNYVLTISGTGNSPLTAEQITLAPTTKQNGGYTEISMIFPNCYIMAKEKVDIRRSDDRGRNFSPVFLTNSIANSNAFLTPFALWESFNNVNTRDSVSFTAGHNYAAGDTLVALSKNRQYPFVYTTQVPVVEGQTIRVPDPVSARFFIAVQNAVWMTKEVLDFTKECEWWKIAAITGIPQCLAYSGDANDLLVGTVDGKLYRIANLALAYNFDRADVSSPSCIVSTTLVKDFEGRVITSAAFDPNDDNHAIVTLGNYGNSDYVYRTTNLLDYAPEFYSIQGNLPDIPVYSSLIEMSGTNRLIIGTEYGIFTTSNPERASTSWTAENAGMGAVPVYMLRQQRVSQWPINNYGVIYAATAGRGAFKSSSFLGFGDPQKHGSEQSMINIYPNPVNSNATVAFTLDQPSHVRLTIFNSNGKFIKTVEMNDIHSGMQKVTLGCQYLDEGTYFLQMVAGTRSASAKFIVLR